MEAGRAGLGLTCSARLQESVMENTVLPFPNAIGGVYPMGRQNRRPDLVAECQHLIRILSFTIDSLCEDSEPNEKKLRHIRALISSLTSLKQVAEEHEHRIAGIPDLRGIDEINGTRYFAVNTCELERFSEK